MPHTSGRSFLNRMLQMKGVSLRRRLGAPGGSLIINSGPLFFACRPGKPASCVNGKDKQGASTAADCSKAHLRISLVHVCASRQIVEEIGSAGLQDCLPRLCNAPMGVIEIGLVLMSTTMP